LFKRAQQANSIQIQSKFNRLPYYWIDIFAVCQHRGDKKMEDLGLLKRDSNSGGSGGSRNEGLAGVISRVKQRTTLVIMKDWDVMKPLTRTWCLFEIWMSSKVYGQHVRILYHKPMGCVSLIYLIQQRAFSTKIE
jgi:hypothetical protein